MCAKAARHDETTAPVLRGAHGRFLRGSAPGPGRGRRRAGLLHIPCPEPLKGHGMSPAWSQLCADAGAGVAGALGRLFEMQEKYAPIPVVVKPEDRPTFDSRYDGLPDEAAVLCQELDIGVADCVHRFELGLPCADIEVLLAQTAIAIRDQGCRSSPVSRWAGVLIREVQEHREQTGKPTGRTRGADRSEGV